MDPLSVTASIIALLQLSSEVTSYVIAAAGAKNEKNKILEELRSCEQILQNLALEAGDSDERQRWSETVRALEAPDAPLGCLTTALTAIRASLRPKDGVARKLLAKVKWPFQEKEILKVIAMIERQKGLLLIALANDSRKLSQGIKKVSKENSLELAELVALLKQTASIQDSLVDSLATVQVGIEDLALRDDNKEIREERRKIHDWLTPIDYTAQQHDHFSRRQAGTGQWLLDSPEFQAWTGSKGQTLCCPGIPGAGKTILASVVVDYLTSEKVCNANTGLAYIYNNFRVNTRVEDLYASLLKQLCAGSTQSPVHDILKSFYDKHKESRFSAEEILKALEAVASIYFRVYIVVDALDECQLPAGERNIFLSRMFELQTNTGAQLFATSRPIPDIIDIFEERSNVVQLEIRATEEDVRRYLQGQLFRLPSCVGRSKELQEHIKTAIVEAVQGMFLLAQLHVESLIGKKSPKAVKTALANLAVGSNAYDYAYNSAMERVEGQTRDQEELAKQVLSWITCAERPLTTLELQHALAVEVGETELDLENLPEVEDMVSVCVGLVTIDKESNIIRLVHYTTQEYFERTQAQWFPHAESEIATTCLTYLSFDAFNTGTVRTEPNYDSEDEDEDCDVDGLSKRLRLYPCYEYASMNWGHHLRRGHTAQSPPDQLLMGFLENEKKVEASCQLPPWGWKFRHSTAAHLAAYFGLENALKELFICCDSSLDARDSDDRTPLYWAAEQGRVEVVELRVSQSISANIDPLDIEFRSPLALAASEGHEAVIQVLLAQPEIEVNCGVGEDPLALAIAYGHPGAVRLLLGHKIANLNSNSPDPDDYSPLTWAVWSGAKAFVEMVLNDARVDSTDLEISIAMGKAAELGHVDIVELLLDRTGFDPENKCPHTRDIFSSKNRHRTRPMSVLSIAALHGQDSVVGLLLENGRVDVNLRDSVGRTPLMYASRYGQLATINLLIEHGASVLAVDNNRGSMLHHAIKLLKHHRTIDRFGDASDQLEVVRRFLVLGVPASVEDSADMTPLHYAAKQDDLEVAELLLQHGVPVDITAQKPRKETSTSSHISADSSNKTLRDGSSQASTAGEDLRTGLTPLHYAALAGNPRMVRFLLDRGANPNMPSLSGVTPLHLALSGSLRMSEKWLDPNMLLELWAVDGDFCAKRFVPSTYGQSDDSNNDADNDSDNNSDENLDNNSDNDLDNNSDNDLDNNSDENLDNNSDNNSDNNWDNNLDNNLDNDSWYNDHNLGTYVQSDDSYNDSDKEPYHFTMDSFQSRTASVKELLEHPETDVNIQDITGHSALHHVLHPSGYRDATRTKKFDMISIFQDMSGQSALHQVRYRKVQVFVKMLIHSGADPFAADNAGMNALHYAAMGGDVEMMASVVGASSSRQAELCLARDNRGRTPLHYLALAGSSSLEAISLLLDAGSDLSATDRHEQNILHHAARATAGSITEDTLTFILENTTLQIEATDADGITPAMLAYEHLRQRFSMFDISDWRASERTLDIFLKHGSRIGAEELSWIHTVVKAYSKPVYNYDSDSDY